MSVYEDMIDHCSYTHKLKPEKNSGLNQQALISQLLTFCASLRSSHSPQLKYINSHIVTCEVSLASQATLGNDTPWSFLYRICYTWSILPQPWASIPQFVPHALAVCFLKLQCLLPW